MVDWYGLSLDITGGSLETLPPSGLLVVVSNHPYGILDNLMMGLILTRIIHQAPAISFRRAELAGLTASF